MCRAPATAVTFRPGFSGQSHQWIMHSPPGHVLALTFRVHRGGPIRRMLWTLWNLANMHATDDIHVELRGADGVVLARASSHNDSPAVVTVRDESGAQVAKLVRDEAALTVSGRDGQPLATLNCVDDGPWQVAGADGRVIGELTGSPDPTREPGLLEWTMFPDMAYSTTIHMQGWHLGLRRMAQYSYVPQVPGPMPPALALLPLLAGLVY